MLCKALVFLLAAALGHFGYKATHVFGEVRSPGKLYMEHLDRLRAETADVTASVQQHSYLVIGGTGFTGSAIVNDLLARGAKTVRIMGRSLPPSVEYPYNGEKYPLKGVEYVKGDVTVKDALRKAMKGISVVIHTAAHYGSPTFTTHGAGKGTEKVNYGGMKNIVEIAQETGVKQLVYTCTSDVTFTPDGYRGADESFPYADGVEAKAIGDHYARTKILAEKHALKADNSSGLRTISLRPNGIYGPGENSAFPKAIAPAYIMGMMPMIFDTEQRSDWVCVYNLVYAHMLAVHQLTANPDKVGGKAFYVTDLREINNAAYKVFEPPMNAVGASVYHWIVVPPNAFVAAAGFMEDMQDWFWDKLGVDLWKNFGAVMFTKKEAYKAVVTHTHSAQRAVDLLGYKALLSFDQCSAYQGEELRRRYGLDPDWPAAN
eukprot:TRINITY_DN35428_c0_g1_i1.p1 TRINITY_DN35428_c0_g1~~TRINITY_DN35428_c0_g1_i1.p1  ORF type:complete len:451 (+),score=178.12 TRINITY_DN35428_c0_g1_i1:63-1355(+)